ncbi:MAG: ABC transporter permease [Candidatus Bathyarchaeia archaeon]
MGLKGYIIKRIINMAILVILVLTINFLIFEAMPGNPLEAYIAKASQSGGMTPERLEELKKAFGIGLPWYEKYPRYVYSMLTFNFGHTTPQYSGKKVVDIIFGEALPNTLLLLGISSVIAIILGILFGAIAAHKRGSLLDSFLVLISLLTFSLPTFWMGLIFQYIFGFYWKILPLQGTLTIEKVAELIQNPVLYWLDRLQYIVLPALVLTLFTYGGFVLLTRACVLEVLPEDYIVTARAKGVKERTVLFKHALKNASLPIITSIALQFGFILSGAIITETVFQYHGLGIEIYNAISMREVPVMQAIFYIIALCVIIANFVADLLYGVIDPRIRYE